MRYHIITYGCQINRSDSERIASVLENSGYLPALKENEADLILVNACSVRQSAVDRVFGLIPKFQKFKIKHSNLKTVLTGCLLKEDKKKFVKGFDFILNIKDLPDWPKIIQEKTNKITLPWQNYHVSCDYLDISPKYQNNFRAFIPISNGCNYACTYCVIPLTRGRMVYRDHQEILREAKNAIENGAKEIWLLGQTVNDYQSGAIYFPKLLKMINDLTGNFWIRFTSPHPKNFSDELIEMMASCQKLTEYLNLPVQSGDNEILKKMSRPYTVEEYKNLVRKIREKIPEVSLSTDVIVGFPGETEKQFQNTARLFKEIKFDMAYIAQFSPRPGTEAFKIADDVPLKEKERRWKVLTDILRKTVLEKNKTYIGKTLDVLVDYNPPTASSRLRRAPADQRGFLHGKTRNYKTIKFRGKSNLIGEFVKVKVIDALSWGLKGEIKNERTKT